MKNIAIVVDMQNGFARYEQTINLTEKISNLLKKNLFDYVVATRFLNADQSIYENLLDWKRLKTEGETHINEIALRLSMPIQQLSTLLFELEMNGSVKTLPGNVYRLKN